MKIGAQTRSNGWLKRHGTQVWKPAIRQAGKPALRRWNPAESTEEMLRAYSALWQRWRQTQGAVMWRPFRPCIRTAILEKGGHGFTIEGTAQGLRYGRLGSLRYKGLPWFCRFHYEISGLSRDFPSFLVLNPNSPAVAPSMQPSRRRMDRIPARDLASVSAASSNSRSRLCQ